MTIGHECAIWIPIFAFTLLFVFLLWHKKLPTVESIQGLATVSATKGGNIIILMVMAFSFFFAGMRLIYYCLGLSVDGKITVDNAVMMLAISFVTGTAFGNVMGALLKTMTGENVKSDTSSVTVTKEVTPAPAIPPTIDPQELPKGN